MNAPFADWQCLLAHLSDGSARQREAGDVLRRHRVFNRLAEYSPVLVGTLPIDVDTPTSDLDILCAADDLLQFAERVQVRFGDAGDYRAWFRNGKIPAHVAAFSLDGFPVEIFAQPCPVTAQLGYLHMQVEARLLDAAGGDARAAIRALKNAGYKTEAAFCIYFGLPGDPYRTLAELALAGDDAVAAVVTASRQIRSERATAPRSRGGAVT